MRQREAPFTSSIDIELYPRCQNDPDRTDPYCSLDIGAYKSAYIVGYGFE
jgi:hypothetical protein